jgi:diguanylate cyclase (GGDEF)-like protein
MDNFKEINDRFGHFMGDRFLGLVGEAISRQIRGSDVGARYGGDEFVVILPNTDIDEARLIADNLAAAVRSCAAMTPSTEEPVQLGISCGIASCPHDARADGELIDVADKQLYEQKRERKAGRGRRVA